MKYIVAVLVLLGCADPSDVESFEARMRAPGFQRSTYSGAIRDVQDFGAQRETLICVGKRWMIVQAWPREVRRYIGQPATIETRPDSRRVMVIDDGWVVLRD